MQTILWGEILASLEMWDCWLCWVHQRKYYPSHIASSMWYICWPHQRLIMPDNFIVPDDICGRYPWGAPRKWIKNVFNFLYEISLCNHYSTDARNIQHNNDTSIPFSRNALHHTVYFTSSPLSATFVCQWTGSVLLQVMACHLFGAKLSPEPVLAYCQMNPWEQNSVEFKSRYECFHS